MKSSTSVEQKRSPHPDVRAVLSLVARSPPAQYSMTTRCCPSPSLSSSWKETMFGWDRCLRRSISVSISLVSTALSSIANLNDFEANVYQFKQERSSEAVSAIRAEFTCLRDRANVVDGTPLLGSATQTYLPVLLSLHKVYNPEASFTQTSDGCVLLVVGSHDGARYQHLRSREE